MKSAVKLLTQPNIDLETLVKTMGQAIGYNPNVPGTYGDYAKYIAILSSFHSRDACERPASAIRRSASLRAHLHFSFLVGCSLKTILKSSERSRLAHTITEQLDETVLAVVSGDLESWKDATVECTTEDCDYNLRNLYNLIYLEFKKLKLTEIWHDTNNVKEKDGTFRIERSR